LSNDQTKEIRFEFGENWSHFLSHLNEDRIIKAEQSLTDMLGVHDLKGKTFLDIGSGSGLSSLAARRLGAKIHSFDYDPQSVACTQELRQRYFPNDVDWQVEEDADYVKSLGQFDVVYSWGVLHHTGAMWEALQNAVLPTKLGGFLFVTIYNDQGRASSHWETIKRLYNRLPTPYRFFILWPAFIRLWGPTLVRDTLRLKPFEKWKSYSSIRGMSPWHDVVDWVGGYPFEVAKPEAIFDFYRSQNFQLERFVTCAGGIGCNEFVFLRTK